MTSTFRWHRSALAVVVVCSMGLVGIPARLAAATAADDEARPARLSFIDGTVSFWRAGAEEWVRARLNTPLAPGDHLYASSSSKFEVQFGLQAFLRGNEDTEVALEALAADYVQFRVPSGVASLDIRSLEPGTTVEISAPDAAFTITKPGYYRVDVGDETTLFAARQGGEAEAVVESGERWLVRPEEMVVVDANDSPVIRTYAASELDEWDRWGSQRTGTMLAPKSAAYLPQGVYGGEDLDRYGTWDDEPTYGRVWYPQNVQADWAPYSEGQWIWDAGYGWSWIDDRPWGWAPCHYGRWVRTGPRWGWAPGPIVARPFYAPAVVGFLAGPSVSVSIGIGAPIGWVALGWGEPIVPWWGRRGFIGQPSWRGWGGPRYVNNVIIRERQVVRVDRIIYTNSHVRGGLVSVPRDQFGRGRVVREAGFADLDRSRFRPVRGEVPVRPTRSALAPFSGPEDRRVPSPGRRNLERTMVSKRKPVDAIGRLQASGLRDAVRRERPERVVVPRRVSKQVQEASSAPAAPPRRELMTGRQRRAAERGADGAVQGQPPRVDRARGGEPGERPDADTVEGAERRLPRDRTQRGAARPGREPAVQRPGGAGEAVPPGAVAPEGAGARGERGRASERFDRRSGREVPPPPDAGAPAVNRGREIDRRTREQRSTRPARPNRPDAVAPGADGTQVDRPAPPQQRDRPLRPARPESPRERSAPARPQAEPRSPAQAVPPAPQREVVPRAAQPPQERSAPVRRQAEPRSPRQAAPREAEPPPRPEAVRPQERSAPMRRQAEPRGARQAAPPARREVAPRAADAPPRPEAAPRAQERMQRPAPQRQAPAARSMPESRPAPQRQERMQAPRMQAPVRAPRAPARARESQAPRPAPQQRQAMPAPVQREAARMPERREPVRAPQVAPQPAAQAPQPARVERSVRQERPARADRGAGQPQREAGPRRARPER